MTFDYKCFQDLHTIVVIHNDTAVADVWPSHPRLGAKSTACVCELPGYGSGRPANPGATSLQPQTATFLGVLQTRRRSQKYGLRSVVCRYNPFRFSGDRRGLRRAGRSSEGVGARRIRSRHRESQTRRYLRE